MTFHRGQSGNHALRDAAAYVAAMVDVSQGSKSVKAAVDDYDKDVLERGRSEEAMSSQQTHAFHDYQAFIQSPIMTHGIRPMMKT
jgi:2-polyprenyl-6-methoxyphenol hydroxylase-like FAD-dependent oxidoreductase